MSGAPISEDVHVESMRGLPAALPPGEHVLWQGTPDWKALAVNVFHVRAIAIYSALLIAWHWATAINDGTALGAAALTSLLLLLIPIGAIGILAVIAWATAASAVYTITSERVVMRIGIALTVTLNLPFKRIVGAAYKPTFFGSGEIALSLSPEDKVSYLVLWPHAKPWALSRPQPALRCIPDGEKAANILARALATYTHQAARQIEARPERVAVPAGAGAAVVSG